MRLNLGFRVFYVISEGVVWGRKLFCRLLGRFGRAGRGVVGGYAGVRFYIFRFNS